jgi:hypothetical protein
LSREPLCPPLPLAASSGLGYVPVVLSLRRLSETTINTVNDDFHKVKKRVFRKKYRVSAQA